MRLQLMATADGRIWFRVLMLVALAIIILPVSMAVSSATGGVLAQSRFSQQNWLRSELGPHHYAVFYRPYRYYAPRRTRYRAKRKYRWRR